MTPARQAIWTYGIGLLGGILAFSLVIESTADFVPSEAGLGVNTHPFRAEFEERPISGFFSDLPALQGSIRDWKDGGFRVALWLGASQIHAINHPEEGDRLAVEHAAATAREQGTPLRFVQVSEPNASFPEILCMYLAFRDPELLPDVLVVGITYDDFREGEIRAAALEHLPPLAQASVPGADAALRVLHEARAERSANPEEELRVSQPVERTATAGTPQERLEDALMAGTETFWPSFGKRHRFRAAVEVWMKTAIRKVAFRFLDRSVRVVPQELEKWNTDALDALAAIARADGIPVVFYKAPHRPGERVFYNDRAAYDRFHASLKKRAAAGEFHYLDLETLVPAECYGLNNAYSPDVFHFTNEGHRRLGEAVEAEVRRVLALPSSGRPARGT